ncbi:hypothetical protein [Methanoculleus sp.]|uniref:hypothetical protein n=1 Tax=Methanoculleus sp. TaxID=90427 RepID=UPI00320E2184
MHDDEGCLPSVKPGGALRPPGAGTLLTAPQSSRRTSRRLCRIPDVDLPVPVEFGGRIDRRLPDDHVGHPGDVVVPAIDPGGGERERPAVAIADPGGDDGPRRRRPGRRW